MDVLLRRNPIACSPVVAASSRMISLAVTPCCVYLTFVSAMGVHPCSGLLGRLPEPPWPELCVLKCDAYGFPPRPMPPPALVQVSALASAAPPPHVGSPIAPDARAQENNNGIVITATAVTG